MTVAQLEPVAEIDRPSTSVALSAEAELLAQVLGEVRLSSLSSETLSAGRRNAMNSLILNFREANRPGWDGYDAVAVTPRGFLAAMRVLLAVPTAFPAPEIGIERDGEITLEWFGAADRVLSVSVSDAGRLTYAGLFEERPVCGHVYMGSDLPSEIIELIRRVIAR